MEGREHRVPKTQMHEQRTWLSPKAVWTIAAPRPVVTLTDMPPIILQTDMYHSMLFFPYLRKGEVSSFGVSIQTNAHFGAK